jgi:hypothetical protein
MAAPVYHAAVFTKSAGVPKNWTVFDQQHTVQKGESTTVFRNLAHPAREIKDSLSFSMAHAVQSRAAVDVIIDDVRNWDSKRPK